MFGCGAKCPVFIDTGSRIGQDDGIDIRTKQAYVPGMDVRQRLHQQYGNGIYLFPAGTSGAPNTQPFFSRQFFRHNTGEPGIPDKINLMLVTKKITLSNGYGGYQEFQFTRLVRAMLKVGEILKGTRVSKPLAS